MTTSLHSALLENRKDEHRAAVRNWLRENFGLRSVLINVGTPALTRRDEAGTLVRVTDAELAEWERSAMTADKHELLNLVEGFGFDFPVTSLETGTTRPTRSYFFRTSDFGLDREIWVQLWDEKGVARGKNLATEWEFELAIGVTYADGRDSYAEGTY